MKHLSPVARTKAIEIANTLLEEGMDEGKAIRIAIAKGKKWAIDHAKLINDEYEFNKGKQ